MKLFKTLLFLIVSTTVISSCEPEALEESDTNLQVQASKDQKDIIIDKKDIIDVREVMPSSIDSLLVD